VAKSKDVKFILKSQAFPAYGIVAIIPTETGCKVKWGSGREEVFDGITSKEVQFKIDEAKASTDSD
jgi:hypothetical protein